MNIKKDIKKTRTENTIRNIIAGFVNKVIVLFLPFLVRTIIIRELGTDYVGIGSLFTSILQVLNVSELGFSSAIVFSMYGPVADNDIKSIKEKLRLFHSVYIIIGIIILLGGLITLPFLPFLIEGEVPKDVSIYWAFVIYLSNTAITYLVFGYKNAILTVYQRNDLISKTNSLVTILRSFIQIVSLIYLKNFYVYAVIIPLSTLLSNYLIHFLSKKNYPELNEKYRFSLKGIKEIKKQIGGIAIGRISLVCRNSFDNIILSSLFGLVTTGIYSNYYYVFSSVTGFLSIILTSMSASVGNSLVTETIEKNERDHSHFDFCYEFMSGFCVICMFSLYQPFMKVWVGSNLMLPFTSMMFFCIYFYVNHLAQIRSVYSEAAGLWWKFKYLSIGEMVSNLLLNIILGKIYGIDGILIATIITAFASSFVGCTIITFKTLFKKSPLKYFTDNVAYLFVTTVGCILIYLITDCIEVNNWLELIVKVFACAFLGMSYLFVVYFLFGTTRKIIIDMIKSVKNKVIKRI